MDVSYGLSSAVDEVDALFGKRQAHEHEVSLSMKTEFMSLWDGMDTDPNSKIVVMGATNRPQELDPAVLRRYTWLFLLLHDFIGAKARFCYHCVVAKSVHVPLNNMYVCFVGKVQSS